MDANNAADLAQRLHDYQLDQPGAAQPMGRRLAQEHGWSADYTCRVMAEYKRFALLSVVAGHVVTPSDAVDQVWHLHLTYTREYWEHFCPNVLGRPLHHEPSRGGTDEHHKYWQLYRQTLASYQRQFGEAAPADIWPAPGERFGARFRRVDSRRFWVLRRPRLYAPARPALWLSLAATLALVGCAHIVDSSSPDSMQGPDFLLFYVQCGGLVFGLLLFLRILFLQTGEPPLLDLKELGLYHLAWLAGGHERVIQTAVAQLYSEGILVPDGAKVSTVRPERSLHPIERAVWDFLQRQQEPWTDRRVAAADIQTLQGELVAARLAPDAQQLARIEWTGLALTIPLFGLGLIRLLYGVANGRPVGFLVMLLLIFCFATYYCVFRKARTNSNGKAYLRMARAAFGFGWRFRRREIKARHLPRMLAVIGASVLSGSLYANLNVYMNGDNSSSGSGGDGGCGGGGCGGGCGG